GGRARLSRRGSSGAHLARGACDARGARRKISRLGRSGDAGDCRSGERPRSGGASHGSSRHDTGFAAGICVMVPIALTVNGKRLQALVEPRTHLADFLREHCRLTGTHLGCEHGVCGACTVLIAGAPARSCLTYAVACDGLAIETIEGFDDDPTMADLREAFSREHALQCGFCTPGMLIAARDIVRRVADADARRIRVELSGNLCRCTGYLGIINAVESVIAARASKPTAATSAGAAPPPAPLQAFAPTGEVAPASMATLAPALEEARTGWTRFEESFVVARSPQAVWTIFADIPAVVACLDGAELTEHDASTAKGKMT